MNPSRSSSTVKLFTLIPAVAKSVGAGGTCKMINPVAESFLCPPGMTAPISPIFGRMSRNLTKIIATVL